MSSSTASCTRATGTNSGSLTSPLIGKRQEGGGGYRTPQNNRVVSSKPQPNIPFAECFSCGEKGRLGNQNRRLPAPAPPSELFFKNGVRALWADKHCPRSLSAFQCHHQQTQRLKQLISQGNCPHLLLQGPSGAGKKALTIALLHDIFGDIKVLSEHRPFTVQGGPHPTITVPIATSKYHVEVNLLHIGEFDKDVLPTIFREINLTSEKSLSSPIPSSHPEFDFKLIMVLNGEKLSREAQLILRRHMDRYGDTCKLVLCCNFKDAKSSEAVLSEAIRSRCQIICVEVPSQEEIVEVLTHVAKKEDISLPRVFAAKIARHCKDSLRKAIVQLEACKNYKYPFTLDQLVHISRWEEDVMQIVADIIADPTSKRLVAVRTKLQALLTDGISPILILQKLLEEFLLRTDLQVKKKICDSANFYERPLREGLAITQLEAFLAEVLKIYKTTQPIPKPRMSLCGSARVSLDSTLEQETTPKRQTSSSPLLRNLD